MKKSVNRGDAPFVKSVLHPTDFSEASEEAFVHALAIALVRQTELTLLHVARGSSAEESWSEFPQVRKTMERWGLLEPGSPQSAVFEDYGTQIRKGVVRGTHVGLSTALYLNSNPHDLIVMATEGLDGAARWLNRSQAESIANWSGTMTLFVPADATRRIVSRDDGEITLQNILVPVDTRPDPQAALEYARRSAEAFGDDQVAVNVLHIGDDFPAMPALKDGDTCKWQTETRKGRVVDEILSAADSHESDLIIMVTEGHNSLLDALRGSTSEQVIRRAPCPVLVVPAGEY